LQLVRSAEGRAVDLPVLRARGVRVTGRLATIDGQSICLAGDLAATTEHAERKMSRLLASIESFIAENGLKRFAPAPEPIVPGVQRQEFQMPAL